LPLRNLSRRELDQRLAVGDRRQGRLLYRPSCPGCHACVPLRVDVTRFEPSRSQRRALRRGDETISVEQGPLEGSPERLRLYNRHKKLRGLGTDDHETDAETYGLVLGDSCCESFELRYRVGDELMGVAVVDRGEQSLSAVYCYYEPELARLSPGTYSILRQIELCREWGLRYLYLGLYIAACRAMTYKAAFLPHERLLDGQWVTVNRS
jgi:arginine-tRNA-protein transferase